MGNGRLFFCVFFSIFVGVAFAGELPEKYMPVDEVKKGMTGVGLSVFRGTKVEEFEFEVIGIARNALPQEDMIIIRAAGQGLEVSGIVSGMSGSPCYIDGRMIGAVARTWSGAEIPYGGVTPIEYMLEIDNPGPLPTAAAPEPLGTFAPDGSRPALASVVTEPLPGQAETLQVDVGGAIKLEPIRSPVFVSGFSSFAVDLLAADLESLGMVPVQGGGAVAGEDAPDVEMEPGSVVVVPLLIGDASMSISGTVTERVGDTIFGFGHQMKRRGGVRLPMATGTVISVIPRVDMSMKLAAPLEVVGTITVDRSEGVVGKIGDMPDMVDVTVNVDRRDIGETETYRLQAVDDWTLTANVLQSALSATATAKGLLPYDNTVKYRIEMLVDGVDEPVVFKNLVAGTGSRGSLTKLVGDLSLTTAALNRNTIHRTSVTSVKCDVTIMGGRKSASIESAMLDRNRAAPGETVTISVELKPYRGENFVREIELTVPDDMPAGAAMIEVCDATTAVSKDRADRPHAYKPQTFEQLMKLVRYDEHRGQIIARLPTKTKGAAIDGVNMPSLPDSMLQVLNFPRRTKKLQPTRKTITASIKTDWMVSGSHRLPLLIQP